MKKQSLLPVLSIGLFAFMGFAFTLNYLGVDAISSTFPPTNAFSKVMTNGETIQASSYNSDLHLDFPYAQISDLTTQSCSINGAASNVLLNTNDEIYKITHSTTSNTYQIILQESGVYQIIAVPQIGEATPQASGVHNFWMLKNGQIIQDTNIKTTVMLQVTGSETMVGTLQYVGKFVKGDIISFQQSCTDSDIGIIFTNYTSVEPKTPSVIISIARIS